MTAQVIFTVPGQPVGKGRGKVKATDDEISSAYKLLRSCKKVAALFGMCAQSVHERVVKIGLVNHINKFSEQEKAILISSYNEYADSGKLDELARLLGRTKQFICRQAGILGLTDKSRCRPYMVEANVVRMKEWHKNNVHPRGALGMKHSAETRKILSDKSKKMWDEMPESVRDDYSKRASISGAKSSPFNRDGASWKAGWRQVGDVRKYYRSRWEANYARYLQWLKDKHEILDWQHEAETFWFDGIKRGCMSYLPDFKVTELSGSVAYHEVKGWMDERSKTKIKRMAKYHPNVRLIIIDSKVYNGISKAMKSVIKDWE